MGQVPPVPDLLETVVIPMGSIFVPFKKKYKRKDIRILLEEITYWDYFIDESIVKLREIKKKFKTKGKIKIELKTNPGLYGDNDSASIHIYAWCKEPKEEFDKRMEEDYKWYVKQEENDIEIYKKMKKKYEG